MAYEVGQRRVRDGQQFNDFALGLSLPITNSNGGYFSQNFTTVEQAKSNIKNLLMTRKGERVMHPNFGSGLHEVLFEQLDDIEFEERILTEIESAIQTWIPYVTLGEVEVDMSNSNRDRNIVTVTISFTVGNDIDPNEVTFTVQE